jgi:hypothetical protein
MAQAFLVGQVKSQLVKLIESYEPQLEQGLSDSLTKIKASNPGEAAFFLEKWKMLDRAVVKSLGVPVSEPASAPAPSKFPSVFRKGGKRTKRHTRKHTK